MRSPTALSPLTSSLRTLGRRGKLALNLYNFVAPLEEAGDTRHHETRCPSRTEIKSGGQGAGVKGPGQDKQIPTPDS